MSPHNEHFDPAAFANFFRNAGQRMGRGDISPIVLSVLKEKPMHGYEIIRRLEEHSHGFWRPSAGSIYPTLQMLEEQELVTSKEEGGKKVYELTKAGRESAEDRNFPPSPPHWKHATNPGRRLAIMKDTIRGLVQTMRRIAFHGTDQQLKEAKEILDEAVSKLETLNEKIRS